MHEELTSFSGAIQRVGPLQSGISQLEWISYRSGAHGLFPNIFRVVAVPEGLPDAAVHAAVDDLLQRHEMLRTGFDADEAGRPRQNVYEAVRAVVPRLDDEQSRRLFAESPFDIATAPPIRFGRTADGDLMFLVAHVAVDETAAGILAADLTELLAARHQRRPVRLSADVVQPIDRALHERGRGRARVESALRHWTGVLRDLPVTALPVSRGRPGADVVFANLVSPAATRALAILHSRFATSPASIFIATAYTALAIQYDRNRLGLSLTWSFRELPDTGEMVASVFRDMPLLIDLAGAPSFSEVLRRVQKAILIGGRHMGFDVLEFFESAGRIDVERGSYLSGPEAVNCIFDGIDWAAEPSDDPHALLSDSLVTVGRSNEFHDVCNLFVNASPVGGQLHIYAAADSGVAGERDVTGIVRRIEAILVHACAGDLAFAAAEALPGERWRPGARWARIGDVWVDLDFLATRLRDHPAVREADVREEQGAVTAYVGADLEPWELRDFLLSTDNGRGATVSPQHFVVHRSDGGTVADSGVQRPVRAPRESAERALEQAVAEANGLAGLTMAGTYLTAGGRLHHAPRVLSLLRDAGFDGITVADLRRPTSLTTLAGRLRARSSIVQSRGVS
ncbi:condensation domain-containing protein [Actinoplanes sp. N902-109]|uniref:condensation domain-containing protein n=1 Tax=Actinoplanes sp. (strain N902-109) TaxID=649831 RepID=UPI00032959EC|nr:condensation domain-containing protein [Actinoplanes sp. N902-109]AGL16369.1 hypothetical protein L083_2859 [Actinoplanes sp. N902-109]